MIGCFDELFGNLGDGVAVESMVVCVIECMLPSSHSRERMAARPGTISLSGQMEVVFLLGYV